MGLAGRATCVQMAAYSHQQTLEFDSRGGRQSALREESLVTGAAGAAKPKIKLVQGQSLDNVAGEETVTLINMDVEGAERQALEGCAKIIARDRPKMLIAAYHRSEDLFAIPLQIAAMRSDYRFICGTILTSLPGTPTFIVYSNRNGRAAGAHFRA